MRHDLGAAPRRPHGSDVFGCGRVSGRDIGDSDGDRRRRAGDHHAVRALRSSATSASTSGSATCWSPSSARARPWKSRGPRRRPSPRSSSGVGESGAGIIVAAQSLGSAMGVLVFVAMRRRGPTVLVATIGHVDPGDRPRDPGPLVDLAHGDRSRSASWASASRSPSRFRPARSRRTSTRAYRGRVMSVHQIAHLGNRPFSALAIGAVAAGFGLPAAALVAVALVPIGIGALRRGWRGGRPAICCRTADRLSGQSRHRRPLSVVGSGTCRPAQAALETLGRLLHHAAADSWPTKSRSRPKPSPSWRMPCASGAGRSRRGVGHRQHLVEAVLRRRRPESRQPPKGTAGKRVSTSLIQT